MNKETLEETAFRLFPRLINDPYNPMEDDNKEYRDIWISGAKWKQERMYSEEDLEKSFKAGREGDMVFNNESPEYWDFNEWYKQFKKK